MFDKWAATESRMCGAMGNARYNCAEAASLSFVLCGKIHLSRDENAIITE
jgi:hypothetical protein